MAINFQQSRPFLVTFVLLAVTMAILERRRWMWALVPVFIFWANCHGGYFMGWVMLGAYCGEALIQRLRKRPVEGERQLWLVTIACFLASAINPNGFRVIEIMLLYRSSSIQSSNLEWQYPAFWEPSGYSLVLFGSLVAMLLSWRRTRPVDWILYFVFAAASLLAVRNTILMGLVGAVLLGAYLPGVEAGHSGRGGIRGRGSAGARHRVRCARRQRVSIARRGVAAAHPGGGLSEGAQRHRPHVQHLRKRRLPGLASLARAARFHRPARPQRRGLRGLQSHPLLRRSNGGKSADELLNKYGIEVLVLDGFDRFSGKVHTLAAALSDPRQTEWKLVQADDRSIVFMRHPPPGVQPLNNLQALTSIETQCQQQIEHDPKQPACARGIADLYTLIGEKARAAQWMTYYESRSH